MTAETSNDDLWQLNRE